MTVLVFVAGVLAGILTMVAVRVFTAALRAVEHSTSDQRSIIKRKQAG